MTMAAETPLSLTHHSAETLSGELLAGSLSASLTQRTQGKGQPVKQCSQDEFRVFPQNSEL